MYHIVAHYTCVNMLYRSGELAQEFEEKKAMMAKTQEDTTFTYHKKKGITMEKKEARAQKEEADRYQKLQDDLSTGQLEEQLFKLYHNEREIETLSDELKNHQKNLNDLVCMYCLAVRGVPIWVFGMY